MQQDLRDILFLDIETIGAVENYQQLTERFKAQWARKANFFKREEGQTDEELFQLRAGIYAEFGKVIVIAVARFSENEKGELLLKTKAYSGHDEKKVLEDFKALIDKADPAKIKLCAHNGKEFDFPYLSRRMLVNGIALPPLLNLSGKKPWEVPHLDTMEMWKFGDNKHYTSLDLLLALFDIPSSKGTMDGSQVNEVYYKEKNLSKITTYCVADVVAIAQLYLKMKNLPSLPEEKIIYST
ncbi:MAG: 3'-5' exonuclease [Bacteroidetes bacterium]|nr:3'-5' exonuclease [Bacteroidota bacterium]MBS1540616.1 3'-5' exonuclease [Bacteroidota bacterium]